MTIDQSPDQAQTEALVYELKKRLGLIKYMGTLGDSDDNSVSTVDEPGRPGYVRVRLHLDDVPFRVVKSGLLGAYSPYAGSPVVVGYDEKGDLAIEKADFDALLEAKVNPLIFNSGDNRVSGFAQTDSLLPLWCGAVSEEIGTASTKIAINSYRYVDITNIVHWFEALKVDLVGEIPGANLHCYTAVFLKDDETIQLVSSTPIALITPLQEADKQECFDGRDDNTTPIWLWRLHNNQASITNADKVEDLRPWLLPPSSGIPGGSAEEDILYWDATNNIWLTGAIGVLSIYADAKRQPNGFEKDANGAPPTDSVISYNPATRTIGIAPAVTSFNYWLKGLKHTVTANQELIHANATDVYFFYWDSANVLTFSTTPWSITEDVPIAYVYYNATLVDGMHFEERHGATRNVNWHYSDHYKRGTFWHEGEGLGIADYVLAPGAPADADNQWSIAAGEIHDEDIAFQVTGRTTGTYEIWSRDGAAGVWTWLQNNVPLLAAPASYVYYNEWTGAIWQQTALANNKYVNYYIMSTLSLDNDFDVFVIMGQAEHSTLAGAVAEDIADLDFGDFPFQEILGIYKVTFRTGAAYGSEGKCRIESVVDTRLSTGSQVINSSPASSHPSLSGLDWLASGHTGLANSFTGFDAGGLATNYLQADYVEVAGDTMTGQLFIDGGADEIQLRVQGAAGQTANLQTWESSAGGILTRVLSNGYLDVGAPQTGGLTIVGNFQDTFIDVSGIALSGIAVAAITGNSAIITTGFNSIVRTSATAFNYTSVLALRGLRANARHLGTGTVAGARSATVRITNSSTGIITRGYGLFVETPTNDGGGTITNSYGLYVEDHNVGGTLNYAIYTNAGDITLNAGLGQCDFLLNGDNYALIQTDSSDDEIWIGNNAAAKISFFAATPIVQPTVAIAAAAFVANTSGIADDTATWDGYTIGQVVKALRNEGLLA